MANFRFDYSDIKLMQYQEVIPGDLLKPYVKCYYTYESDIDSIFEDRAFATGCVELMFNIGEGKWQTNTGDGFTTTPQIELWGQIIQPLKFRSLGKNRMLGVRFYPHTASIFLEQDICLFNDRVSDFAGVAGNTVQTLHSKLAENITLQQRVQLVEAYLVNRLGLFEKKFDKIKLVSSVMNELKQQDFFDNIDNVASRHGITSRYLQKIFLQYSGLTPKLYSKINRFQNSLQLVAKRRTSLTDIAYECGYFDQSHFIREFKSFTGFLPSAYDPENSSALLASPNQ